MTDNGNGATGGTSAPGSQLGPPDAAPVADVPGAGAQPGRGRIRRCLGCDVIAGRRPVPGGVLHETEAWVVNHVVGPMNLGTLVLSPRDHVVALADLSDRAAAELGPLSRRAAQVVESLLEPEQTYVSSWAHGDRERKHLHIVVQPVTRATVEEYGGARSEQLQALMLASGKVPPVQDIERFCQLAAELFAASTAD